MNKLIVILIALCLGLATRSQAQTVYSSEKGEKYHTADCRLSGDASETTLVDAKKKGKGACGMCKPETHFKDKVKQCAGKTSEGKQCKRMTASKEGTCFQHKKPDKS
ncbi:MAG: hypothetical protein SH819_00925 [Cytophagales bacterium]|nr:hypothetical protein [Cytophagales bacterium]